MDSFVWRRFLARGNDFEFLLHFHLSVFLLHDGL
jgi:hypothetical protein